MLVFVNGGDAHVAVLVQNDLSALHFPGAVLGAAEASVFVGRFGVVAVSGQNERFVLRLAYICVTFAPSQTCRVYV